MVGLLFFCGITTQVSAQLCTTPESGNMTFMPALPASGVYPPGTTVNMCIQITSFSNAGDEWIHAVVPILPPLYDMSTFVPTSIPASCDGTGTWGWYPAGWTACSSGTAIGPAFGYESGIGLGCGGTANDGNPGNNFGDGFGSQVGTNIFSGPCAVINQPSEYKTFCWNVNTVAVPGGACSAANQAVRVLVYGDGTSANYAINACSSDEPLCFPRFNQPTASWTPACPGQSIQLTGGLNGNSASCGAVLQWTLDGQPFSPLQNPTTTTPGTYQFGIGLNNCAPAFSAPITVSYPTLGLTFSPNPIDACAGQPFSVTATPTGFTGSPTIQWFNNTNPGSPILIGTGATLNFVATGSFPIKAVASNNSGCMAMATGQVNFSITPTNVQITASPAGPYCVGDVVVLTATSDQDPNPFYTWNNGSNTNPRTITLNAPGNFNYSVTAASGTCTAMAMTNLNVAAAPNAMITGPTTICGGNQVTLNATGGTQYDWSWPGGTATVLH